MIIFSEAQIRKNVKLDATLFDLMADAFLALALPDTVQPPIMQINVPGIGGLTCFKSAYVASLGKIVLKSVSIANDAQAVAGYRANGFMLLLDAVTLEVDAILQDGGYLTQIRTAAAGGLAVSRFAPASAATLGIVGSGRQAALQIEAACLARSFERILIWSRSPQKAQTFVDEMAKTFITPIAVAPLASVVRQADVLITTTKSREPLIEPSWLPATQLIVAMGSDAPGKVELGSQIIQRADRIVCDVIEQSRTVGELAYAKRENIPVGDLPIEALSDALASGSRGPTYNGITVVDLTGAGVQDAAIATHAFNLLTSGGHHADVL